MKLVDILGIGGKLIEARTDLRKAEIEAQAARVRAEAEARTEAVKQGHAWEVTAAQNAASSWLDEFWTVILAAPFVAAFFPAAQDYIAHGFSVLEETAPDFYVNALYLALTWAFARRGLKGAADFWSRKRP